MPEIKTSTAIYADDVQLLFSGTPNNLEQLKAHAKRSLNTINGLVTFNKLINDVRLINLSLTMKDWHCDNGLKMNSNKSQCILLATINAFC